MNDKPELLIARDIVTKIAEGDVSIVDNLINRSVEYDEIVLLTSALAEGIENAKHATAEGMHALADLVCHSRIENSLMPPCSKKDDGESLAIGYLKHDFLLKYMIAPNADDYLETLLDENFPINGFRFTTHDFRVAIALLCLRDTDLINSGAFGRLLNIIYVDLSEEADRDCDEWVLSEEFIENVRTKVFEYREGQ